MAALKSGVAQKVSEIAREIDIDAIESQIHTLNRESEIVNSQINELRSRQKDLTSYLEEWRGQKASYDGDRSLSEVVIVNLFEGVCADKIQKDLSHCIEEMDYACGKVAELNDNIESQITRLNQQLTQIHRQLKLLKIDLDSI